MKKELKDKKFYSDKLEVFKTEETQMFLNKTEVFLDKLKTNDELKTIRSELNKEQKTFDKLTEQDKCNQKIIELNKEIDKNTKFNEKARIEVKKINKAISVFDVIETMRAASENLPYSIPVESFYVLHGQHLI